MLHKIVATTAGFACLAQNVNAQEEDTLAVIPDGDIPEGGLGAEVPIGEEMVEEGTMDMEGEEDHDDHEGEEGHEDHDEDKDGDEDGDDHDSDHEGHDDHDNHEHLLT